MKWVKVIETRISLDDGTGERLRKEMRNQLTEVVCLYMWEWSMGWNINWDVTGENKSERICSFFPWGNEPGGKSETVRMRYCFLSIAAKHRKGLSATSCLHVETSACETNIAPEKWIQGSWSQNNIICLGKCKSKCSLSGQQEC